MGVGGWKRIIVKAGLAEDSGRCLLNLLGKAEWVQATRGGSKGGEGFSWLDRQLPLWKTETSTQLRCT